MTDPTPPDSIPEPSMEEILASIRQIISEDLASVAAADSHAVGEPPHAARSEAEPGRPDGARAASGDDDDDVLILTERAPSEPSPFAPPSPREPAVAEAAPPTAMSPTDTPTDIPPTDIPRTDFPRTDLHDADPRPVEPEQSREAAEPGSGPGRSLALAPSSSPAVVAPETAAVVAASFERLALVVENTSPPPFTVSHGGATLEDITREILTPVIKAWLDENLAGIVQARVDEEVERIARGRVR